MLNTLATRRSFLKLTLTSALIFAGVKPSYGKNAVEGGASEGRLSLYNIHTSEKVSVTYKNESGDYDLDALASLNWILRCHYTNKIIDMDVSVIDFLNTVDNHFGGNNRIHIISGFRSPEYNGLLQKEGRRVARHSLHLEGKAIDFYIPGVTLNNIRTAALHLRYGGVGYYPHTGFVHIDSGNFRTW